MTPAHTLGRDPQPGRDRVRVQVPEGCDHVVLGPGNPPLPLPKAPDEVVVTWSDYFARLCGEGALEVLGFDGGGK